MAVTHVSHIKYILKELTGQECGILYYSDSIRYIIGGMQFYSPELFPIEDLIIQYGLLIGAIRVAL